MKIQGNMAKAMEQNKSPEVNPKKKKKKKKKKKYELNKKKI